MAVCSRSGEKELTLGDTMMMKAVKLGQASHRALREWMHRNNVGGKLI